jgi:hypothetical protein
MNAFLAEVMQAACTSGASVSKTITGQIRISGTDWTIIANEDLTNTNIGAEVIARIKQSFSTPVPTNQEQ